MARAPHPFAFFAKGWVSWIRIRARLQSCRDLVPMTTALAAEARREGKRHGKKNEFGESTYDQCSFGPRAREVVQLNDKLGRIPVTPGQVRWTVRLTLQAFQVGVGFKAIPRASCRRGRISTSPICKEVWEALEKHGVIGSITIKGLLDDGVQVPDNKREEVRLFLSNAILSGSLRDAVGSVIHSVVPKGTTAAG